MATGTPPTFPILDIVTQEDMHAAAVRVVLARSMTNPDAYLETHTVEARVANRLVEEDGKQKLLAAVVLLGAVLKVPKVRETEVTSSPLPDQAKR